MDTNEVPGADADEADADEAVGADSLATRRAVARVRALVFLVSLKRLEGLARLVDEIA